MKPIVSDKILRDAVMKELEDDSEVAAKPPSEPTAADVERRVHEETARMADLHARSVRVTILTPEAPHEREEIDRVAPLSQRGGGQGIFLVVRFRAPDYARMKRAFDDLQPLRERHGARGHRILRLADDPQDYIVIIDFASVGGAQGFTKDPFC